MNSDKHDIKQMMEKLKPRLYYVAVVEKGFFPENQKGTSIRYLLSLYSGDSIAVFSDTHLDIHDLEGKKLIFELSPPKVYNGKVSLAGRIVSVEEVKEQLGLLSKQENINSSAPSTFKTSFGKDPKSP